MANKLLLNVLACGLILSSTMQGIAAPKKATVQDVTWKAFTSTQCNYSIEFPTEPEEVEQTIEIPNTTLSIAYNTFLSEPNDQAVYVVSVWNYPEEIDMSKPEVNLQDGFGGMLSALPGSEVLKMQMGEVQGFKALEFLVNNDDINFRGKLILVNNTLYQVFVVYKADVDMEADYAHFIDSFKLLNAEKKNGMIKKTKKLKV